MSIKTAAYEKIILDFHKKMRSRAKIAKIRLEADKWTLLEMVGHLVDSASNNHQRFIRLQLESALSFPAYAAEEWKNVSKTNGLDYAFMIEFWKMYNLFLIHIIQKIDETKLENYWEIGGKRMTLSFLVEDYFAHVKWHAELFEQRAAEVLKK